MKKVPVPTIVPRTLDSASHFLGPYALPVGRRSTLDAPSGFARTVQGIPGMTGLNGRFEVNGVVARIVRSLDGGPIRQMGMTGSTKPTGTFTSVKGRSRAMPWESMKCELPALQLAEVASPVVSLMAQPHRLELFVRRRRNPLIYFPDLELTVESKRLVHESNDHAWAIGLTKRPSA